MSLEKKLNICIVAREYPPETLWGGIGTFTYNLAQGLRSIGHNVDVLAFTFGEESSTEDTGVIIHRITSPRVPFCNKTYWDYVHFLLSPFAFFYSYKLEKKIDELYKERNYDVIDFPEHIGEGFFTILKDKYPSLVRLYTPLSLIGHLGLNKTTNSIDYYLFGLMEKSSLKRATIINSPSKALAELVSKEFRIKKNIKLIYNPIDTNRFSPENSAVKTDRKIIKALFVGRLTDRKGVHILALAIPEIVKKVDAIEFTILGNDDEGVNGFASMRDYMMDVFENNNVLDKVKMLDQVPYEELHDVYNQADLSIVPSLYDNSPYTCLEAMSCGLPVIGTSAGGMPEYIDDGMNGIIIKPDDVDALVDAVVWLAKDKDRIAEFGIRARKKAVREFNRKKLRVK